VRLGISKERGESIANEAEAFLAADALPPGSAATFAERLSFATSWAQPVRRSTRPPSTKAYFRSSA